MLRTAWQSYDVDDRSRSWARSPKELFYDNTKRAVPGSEYTYPHKYALHTQVNRIGDVPKYGHCRMGEYRKQPDQPLPAGITEPAGQYDLGPQSGRTECAGLRRGSPHLLLRHRPRQRLNATCYAYAESLQLPVANVTGGGCLVWPVYYECSHHDSRPKRIVPVIPSVPRLRRTVGQLMALAQVR